MKCCLWSYLYARKKLESYDTSNKLYRRRHTKVGFLKNPLSESVWHMLQKGRFLVKNFFSKALRKFSTHRVTTLNIFERLFKIISLRLKKIRVIWHAKQIIWKEIYKSLDFWKIHSQNPVSIWFKNTYFQGKKFFQMVLKNFLSVVWQCLIYLEGCLRPYLYSRKKIGVVLHIDQKILTKNRFAFRKKLVWNFFPLYHCNA